MKNTAVLEKAADDADDANIIAQAGDFWPQATDAADDQIDADIGAGSFVQFFDDLLINKGVQLRNNARRFARAGIVALAFDQLDKPAMHIEWRDHQFFQTGITGKTGQRVKHG